MAWKKTCNLPDQAFKRTPYVRLLIQTSSCASVQMRVLGKEMQLEHRVRVNAPPEIIFRIYEDVSRWNTWDPDTKSATIEGPFQAGSRGKLTPAKGNTVPMLLTEVIQNKSFTVESKIPFFRMVFEHELHTNGEATEVLHRVTFSGFLSTFLGPVIAKQINQGLPVTLGNLKQLAESQYAVKSSSGHASTKDKA